MNYAGSIKFLQNRQSVQYLVFDVLPPMEYKIMERLCESFQKTVILACELKGISKIPAIGIMAVGTYCECFFPLQEINKSNLPKFTIALKSLLNFFDETSSTFKILERNAFSEIFQNITLQWSNFQKLINASENIWAQLQITVFSSMAVNPLSCVVEESLKCIDLTNIKKILVVTIYNPLLSYDNEQQDQSCSGSHDSHSSNNISMTGIVDKMEIINNEYQFDNILRSWFHNVDVDEEHVHLIFKQETDDNLIIKCDIFDKIINPALLLQSKQFYLSSDSYLPTQTSFTNASRIIAGPYHLIVKTIIKLSGICESVIFGMPLILHATRCWKIDWEYLEINQQYFYSLCQNLHEKESALIAELQTVSHKDAINVEKVSGYFVVIPSPSKSLLIKSIAVNELILPDLGNYSEQTVISNEINVKINTALNVLPSADEYNPLYFFSNLFKSINMKIKNAHSSKLFNKKNRSFFEKAKPNSSKPSQRFFSGKFPPLL